MLPQSAGTIFSDVQGVEQVPLQDAPLGIGQGMIAAGMTTIWRTDMD